MIRTSTAFPLFPDPAITPFCDKDFQSLRTTTATIYRICLMIIYTVASYCCWIFSEDVSHYCDFSANYYQQLNFAQSEALDRFGNIVIDFSANTARRPPATGYVNEIEALKELYGDELIHQWSALGSSEISINPTKLKCLNVTESEDGCCFGMCMDFISRYLKEVRNGTPPLEAVKLVAPTYAEGATEEAEISQIFYLALDPENALENQAVKTEIQFEERVAALEQRVREEAIAKVALEAEKELTEIHALKGRVDATKIENRVAAFHTELSQKLSLAYAQIANERLAAFTLETNNEMIADYAKIDYARGKIIAQQMGLSFQSSLFNFLVEENQIRSNDFHNFVAILKTGAYRVGLSQISLQEPIRHSLVFIKTDNLGFILDPNLATVAFPQEEAAQGLWEMATSSYLLKGQCSISFSLMELL